MKEILARGIDISEAQTNIDWDKLNVDFVIIRAGYGRYTKQKDKMFETHYKNAKEHNIPCGAYWFSYSDNANDGNLEADACLSIIKGKKFEYPIFYDIEDKRTFALGASTVDKIANDFCKKLESNGWFCGIYGGQDLAENYLSSTTRNRFAFWYAAYLKEPRYTGAYGMWQYGVAGDVKRNNPLGIKEVVGVTGKCDMDYCYYDYPTAIKNKKLNGYGDTTPVNPTTTPDPVTGFVPRLTIPEYGNKYYNSTGNGGYAVGCIKGSPQQPGLDILSNCVPYSAARFNEIGKYGCWKYLKYPPNAENFIEKAQGEGLTISKNPSLGAIIVWQKGATLSGNDGAGHVAVVEVINADGTIVTSESGYNAKNPFWTTTRNNKDGNWNGGSAYKFRGFVVNPAVVKQEPVVAEPTPEPTPDPEPEPVNKCPYPEPTRSLKNGMNGDDVKWMQWYLNEYGMMFKDIDGVFDLKTLAALITFQFKYKLQIDASCGPITRKALKDNLK